jgi:hypothetical protein
MPTPGAATTPLPIRRIWTCSQRARRRRKATRPSGERAHRILKESVIQANAHATLPQPSEGSRFDDWLHVSALEKGGPVLFPAKLAAYHLQAFAGITLNRSTTTTSKYIWLLAKVIRKGPPTLPSFTPGKLLHRGTGPRWGESSALPLWSHCLSEQGVSSAKELAEFPRQEKQG